jgi:phosphatidylinositol alpha-1,6-mannosyltransferase
VKVLYLTDSLSDLDGVGRYAVSLLRALEARAPGFAPSVLLARKHRPTSADVPAHWPVRVALPPDYFFYMSPLRFWASLVHSTLAVARAARGVDLVHGIKDYPHNLVGLLGARLAGKPFVATAHGTYTVQPLVDRRHARLARAAYRRFDGMITVSRYTARRLAQTLGTTVDERDGLVVGRARVRTVPNCVDPAPLERPTGLDDRPWHHWPFTLGIGELKERKGHHLAFAAVTRALAHRPQLHHVLVGNRPGDAYERSLLAAAQAAGVAERVHLVGNVSEVEKRDLLQRCRVFVHTPVRAADGGFEGFGIVYLEAGAAGRPALGTLDCGAEDAIVHERTGLLAAPEPEAVHAALVRLLDDPALADRMGAAGREHARANTWERNAGAVLEVYAEALRGRGRGR